MLRILTALAAVFLSWPAFAQQPQCGPRAAILAQLERRFGEQVIARGLDSAQHMVELLWSPAQRSWTVLLTTPDMISCIAGAGLNMELYKPLPAGEGA